MVFQAVFFGGGKQSLEQDLSIAIYSALCVLPISVVFPGVFRHLAYKLQLVRDEQKVMQSFNVKVRSTNTDPVTGCLQWLTLAVLWVISAGMIFLCLVYGMQFDLKPVPAGQATVGARWLYAVMTGFLIDVLATTWLVITATVFLGVVRGRASLDAELHRRAQLKELAEVKQGDILFSAQRPSEFVAFVQHKLMWVPREQNIEVEGLERGADGGGDASNDAYKSVAKSVGLAMLQSLAFLALGRGGVGVSTMSTIALSNDDFDAPSLDSEVAFVPLPIVSLARMRGERRRITWDEQSGRSQHLFLDAVECEPGAAPSPPSSPSPDADDIKPAARFVLVVAADFARVAAHRHVLASLVRADVSRILNIGEHRIAIGHIEAVMALDAPLKKRRSGSTDTSPPKQPLSAAAAAEAAAAEAATQYPWVAVRVDLFDAAHARQRVFRDRARSMAAAAAVDVRDFRTANELAKSTRPLVRSPSVHASPPPLPPTLVGEQGATRAAFARTVSRLRSSSPALGPTATATATVSATTDIDIEMQPIEVKTVFPFALGGRAKSPLVRPTVANVATSIDADVDERETTTCDEAMQTVRFL